MADSSFDVVSKVDRQEVDNALNQTVKELNTRYDFRGTGAGIEWSGEDKIVLSAEMKGGKPPSVDAVLEKLGARFWSTEGGIEVVVALAKAGARK